MHTIRFFFICLLLIFPTQVFGQGFADSPWPMLGHDPGHTFRGDDAPPATDVLKWQFKAEAAMGSPTIGCDGTIYAGSVDHNIYAINPDGSMKWKYTTEGAIPMSAPAIGGDGTIYVGSDDFYLYALNPDGTFKWKYKTDYPITSSPIIGYDGFIYISSQDGFLYVLNPDGVLQWKYDFGTINDQYPAIGRDGTVYFSSGDSYLCALNPDGTFRWKYELSCCASPSVSDNDSTIYVSTYYRELAAFNLDGTLKWKTKLGENYFSHDSPSIGRDGTVYVGSHDFSLYAVNPDSTLKWSYETDRHIYASAAIGSDGCVYVQNYYNMYAINPDGTLRWMIQDMGYAHAELAIGSDGTLYFGSDEYLYALAPEEVAAVESKPVAFAIESPYPNPFNPSTVLTYSLGAPSHVKIAVYSINGQKVTELTNAYTSAGSHSVVFDGSKYASGVYFYRFTSSSGAKTGKMLLVK